VKTRTSISGMVIPRRAVLVAGEVLLAVAVATGAVALLEGAAPVTGLGVLYLLAVLWLAIRRGELAALAAAVLAVLALNWFFIPPKHELTVANSENVAALVVFLIVAVVVGRLAAMARARAAEAEARARTAAAREREAALIARAASAVIAGRGVEAELASIAAEVARATGAATAHIGLAAAPSPGEGELAIRLPLRDRSGWLHVAASEWPRADLERLAEPIARLVEVAVERERLEDQAADTEAARRAAVAKTAVLHAISHDLRSPLTAISTSAGALRGELSSEDRRELIGVIEGEAERLARLVDDLLDLSRIQAGAVRPRQDWCDLRDIVERAAAQVQDRHGSRPVVVLLPEDLPLVRADAAQLERVFSNLIENAVKFSPPESPVAVRGGGTGHRVTVRVVDQGPGIPRRDRPQLFEPFFRGAGGRGVGAGLGLAICRGFVEANGGRIVLQSDAGSGTSFAVSFPLVEQPVAAG
jgi:two-component system, OmpR family, sensor histidine kinase KdpD